MDMAFLNAANRARHVPAARPVAGGRRPQLLLPRPPRDGDPGQAHRRRARPAATTSPSPRCSALTAAAVFTRRRDALGGGARAARRASRAGLAAVGLVLVAGNLEGARLLIADGGPLRAYDWFGGVARDRRHDQRVPVVLVPARRPARARARAAVHAARARLRAAGRARRAAAGAARPRAARGRGVRARGRLPLRGQRVVVSRDGGPAGAGACSPGCATRAASRRARRGRAGCCACSRRARCSMLPFHLSFDPAARGIGVVQRGTRVRRLAARRRCCCYGSLAALVALAYARAAAGDTAPGPQRWPGSRSRRVFARLAAGGARLRARRRCSPSRCWSRCGALFSPRASAGRAGGLAAGRRRRRRACSGPSCSTCATSSTAAALYRMNTVFKLGYQAWLLLGLAAIGALAWRARVARRGAAALALGPLAALLVAAASSTRWRARTRARTASRARRRSTASAGCASARPATSARSTGSTTHAAGGDVVLESVGDDYSRVRPRAHLDLHGPADRARLARPRAASGATTPGTRRADVARMYERRRAAGVARAAAPLRGPLRRRRAARAHGLRRRGRGEVGRARAARASTAAGTNVWGWRARALSALTRPGARRATPAARRSRSTARGA